MLQLKNFLKIKTCYKDKNFNQKSKKFNKKYKKFIKNFIKIKKFYQKSFQKTNFMFNERLHPML